MRRFHSTNGPALFSTTYLQTQFEEVVLEIGSKQFTRQDLIEHLQNNHVRSARFLNTLFRKLGIKTHVDILQFPMLDWARIAGVGEAALRTLIDLLIDSGISDDLIEQWLKAGQSDLKQWNAVVGKAVKSMRGKRRKHVV